MVTRQWKRSGAVYAHSGAQPLVQNQLMIDTGPAGYTLTRSRIDLELSVIVAGTDTGGVAGFWSEVLVVAALWWNQAASAPSTSPTPITDINVNPEYVFWDVLHPTVNYFDNITPAYGVTWKGGLGTIESFAQRKSDPDLVNTAWLTWEIIDNIGLINTTVAGTSYFLGGFFGSNLLYESV